MNYLFCKEYITLFLFPKNEKKKKVQKLWSIPTNKKINSLKIDLIIKKVQKHKNK